MALGWAQRFAGHDEAWPRLFSAADALQWRCGCIVRNFCSLGLVLLLAAVALPSPLSAQALTPPTQPAADGSLPATSATERTTYFGTPEAAAPVRSSAAELEQLAAPIALYPDALLSQVLMASTYPLEVVMAARWVAEAQNAALTGDALARALEDKDWDPSVKSLVPFPDVLKRMDEHLDWTEKLGKVFVAQQADVMDAVQRLRQQARMAGTLASNDKQNVKIEDKVIVIQPATSTVVYVPYYDPWVVFGAWPYSAYPPYFWGPPRGVYFVGGWWWGPGVIVVAPLWGWGWCDWYRRDVYIDVVRYNRIERRRHVESPVWHHDPYRGSPDYRLRPPLRGGESPRLSPSLPPPSPGVHDLPAPPARTSPSAPAPRTPMQMPRQYRVPEQHTQPPRSSTPPAPMGPRQYRVPEQHGGGGSTEKPSTPPPPSRPMPKVKPRYKIPEQGQSRPSEQKPAAQLLRRHPAH